jgi:hypothetical protein
MSTTDQAGVSASYFSVQDSDVDTDLDLSSEAQLQEELSPYDPSVDDRPVLYVQILTTDLEPRPGLNVTVTGDGLPEPRSVVTDSAGEFLLEDCGPGVYRLEADSQSFLVHTLMQRDLDDDDAAYRVVI